MMMREGSTWISTKGKVVETGHRQQLSLVVSERKEENKTVTSKEEARRYFFIKVGRNSALCACT